MDVPKFGAEAYLISIGMCVTIAARVNFINHDGGTGMFPQLPKYRDAIKFGRIVIDENGFHWVRGDDHAQSVDWAECRGPGRIRSHRGCDGECGGGSSWPCTEDG